MYQENPTEFMEGRTLAQYLGFLQNEGKVLVYTHANQEMYTKSFNQKRKAKLSGVQPGLPDYIIVTPSRVLFLELKRVKGGHVSDYQKAWIQAIGDGKKAIAGVCHGFDEAKAFLDLYL